MSYDFTSMWNLTKLTYRRRDQDGSYQRPEGWEGEDEVMRTKGYEIIDRLKELVLRSMAQGV
jgi:hypothetical protein